MQEIRLVFNPDTGKSTYRPTSSLDIHIGIPLQSDEDINTAIQMMRDGLRVVENFRWTPEITVTTAQEPEPSEPAK